MDRKIIKLTVTEDEKAEIKAAATSSGMDVSTYVRVSALRAARGN